MKRQYILICMLLLMLLTLGCAKNVEPEIPPVPDEPLQVSEQEPREDEEDEADYYKYSLDAENPVLFDFAEFPQDDFPCGLWTINQLADKFGSHERIEATRSVNINDINDINDPIDVVFINVTFKDAYVVFIPKGTSCFSFFYKEIYNEMYESGEHYFEEKCVLNEGDKNIELEILELTFYDKNLVFPYGIKIGQSTITDIIAAYPEGSADLYQKWDKENDCFHSSISVYYDFPDEGGSLPEFDPPWHGYIRYEFDESDILQSINISWQYFLW